uniref:Uncharacterized protein n=1 Tax=Strigamia maritima TaxID=126957 RepID=T1JC02_STRMM
MPLQSVTYDEVHNSETVIEVSVVNNYVRTVEESFSYDIISLLCDIGGNIGLYFGMSCLTLVEIVVYCCKILFIKTNKRTIKADLELKEKIQTALQENKMKIKVKNRLKNIVVLFLILISIYNIYSSINSYFEYPLSNIVRLERDDLIRFPLIIDCRDNNGIYVAKIKLAVKLKTHCRNYHLFDLLHESSEFSNKPLELWNYSSNFDGIYKDGYSEEIYTNRNQVVKFANLSILSTIFGLCTVFKKDDLPYFPKKNNLYFSDRYSTSRARYYCNPYQTNFILPQNQFFHPKHLFYVHRTSEMKIDISRQTFVRVNTPKRACKTNDLVSKCEQQCYVHQQKQRPLECK